MVPGSVEKVDEKIPVQTAAKQSSVLADEVPDQHDATMHEVVENSTDGSLGMKAARKEALRAFIQSVRDTCSSSEPSASIDQAVAKFEEQLVSQGFSEEGAQLLAARCLQKYSDRLIVENELGMDLDEES